MKDMSREDKKLFVEFMKKHKKSVESSDDEEHN